MLRMLFGRQRIVGRNEVVFATCTHWTGPLLSPPETVFSQAATDSSRPNLRFSSRIYGLEKVVIGG